MKPQMRVKGFTAGAVACGIKTNGKEDVSLILSMVPAQAVAVFTTNRIQAAPVVVAQKRLKNGKAQALLINSGNANAATGEEGYKDTISVTRAVAERLGINESLVVPASTGIIGQRLPAEKIIGHAGLLVNSLSEDGIPSAEEGIMTTDAFPKIEHRTLEIDGREVAICGIAKGAGMIEPHMATLLAFILTDARIKKDAMRRAFAHCIDRSFNAISVDGCMSTNDTVIMLANGCAGNRMLCDRSGDTALFTRTLLEVMESLAKSVVRDGEGATKLITIDVMEARSGQEAKRVAYTIANSNLVKTAFYGGDPNWGRIVSAIGAAGIKLDPGTVSVTIENVTVFSGGTGVPGATKKIEELLKRPEIHVVVTLGRGRKTFRLYTSDLSHAYVDINALYHT